MVPQHPAGHSFAHVAVLPHAGVPSDFRFPNRRHPLVDAHRFVHQRGRAGDTVGIRAVEGPQANQKRGVSFFPGRSAHCEAFEGMEIYWLKFLFISLPIINL